MTTTAPRPTARPGAPDVPGYRLEGPLGHGGAAEVYAARDPDGRRVAVHLLPDTPRLRRRAAALIGVRHPHLLRLDAVEVADDGRLAVIGEAHPGTTLADVLAARRHLTDGEVAGLLDALGHGLGRLHEAGLAHGDLTADNVLLAADGRAVLADLLTDPDLHDGRSAAPERAGRGDPADRPPADAASDVFDLATLLASCRPAGPARGTTASTAVARALAPALRADPARRPTARDLAARAPQIGAAVPLELPPGADLAPALLRARPTPTPRAGARPGRPRGRGAARRLRVVLGSVAGAAAGVALGFGAFHGLVALGVLGGDEPAGTTANTTAGPTTGAAEGPAPVDEAGITVAVADLVSRRDAALRDLDAAALAALTVPDGAAAREDARLVADLTAAGERPADLRTDVVSVDLLGEAADAGGPLRVRAQLAQRASVRETPDGTRAVPALPARCVELDLAHDADGGLVLQTSRPCD